MNNLFSDLKTDLEKSAFFLSGRAHETGIIALAIQNDVAMAYHRCAEYEKEVQVLRKDAERYRFLAAYCRSTSEHWGGRWSIVVDGPCPASHDSEDDLDAAIDAAMEKHK